jgi:hypothetical protein
MSLSRRGFKTRSHIVMYRPFFSLRQLLDYVSTVAQLVLYNYHNNYAEL